MLLYCPSKKLVDLGADSIFISLRYKAMDASLECFSIYLKHLELEIVTGNVGLRIRDDCFVLIMERNLGRHGGLEGGLWGYNRRLRIQRCEGKWTY